jgi:hypothetical protein
VTERGFRFILGATLLLLLFFRLDQWIYVYIGVLIFEGLTNWRVPIVVSKLRYGSAYQSTDSLDGSLGRISFDAERALRLIVALMLIGTFVLFPEQTWFFPWFIGFMLFMAGMTNICPMVMGLRAVGFK